MDSINDIDMGAPLDTDHGSLMHGPTLQTINNVVRDQTGGEVHFKVKPHTKFNKVFEAYCNKKAVGAETIKSVPCEPPLCCLLGLDLE